MTTVELEPHERDLLLAVMREWERILEYHPLRAERINRILAKVDQW